MNLCVSVIIILSVATKESLQTCVSVNTWERLYYARFQRISSPKKYIQCQNEIISSDFHKKVDQLITTNSQIQWLQINNTDSPEIAAGAFSTLYMLSDLRINEAGVQVIQPGAFDGLRALTELSLKNNKIVHVEEHYFMNLTKLSGLDLSFNNIASITENSFVDLRQLQRLILQNNFLVELSPNVFENLQNVEILDLSFNKLVEIDDELLKNVTNLKTLFLNNNNLHSFDGSVFSSNSRITNLYINDNFLKVLNNVSFTNSLSVFNVSHNILRSLRFSKYTQIRTLDLTSSGITSIKNLSFMNLAVTELYLDQNLLGLNPIGTETFSNLSSLEIISLTDNQIQQLNPNLFKNNNRVRKLNLAKNYLRSDNPLSIPISVQDLNLSSNNFDSRLNVTNLINLRTFDISFNNLTEIRFNFLAGLKWLFTLNLNNNRITKINLGCFRSLKALKEINLSYNQISVLELGVFVGLDTLFRLDLSHNNLAVLNEGVFHNLRFLQVLNLGYNNISYSSVENGLSHLSGIREIGLAGNGWSCSLLTNILKENKRVKLTNAGDYEVTNVDGIACKYEVTDPTNLINLETNSFTTFNSKLNTNNAVLILIFIVLIVKIVVKYVPLCPRKDKFKNRLWRAKSEEELQLVNDC